MKKLILLILLGIVLLGIVLVLNTFRHPFVKLADNQPEPIKVELTEQSIKRFSRGIQFATVSHIDSSVNDFAVYDSFRMYLRSAYPKVFNALHDTLI